MVHLLSFDSTLDSAQLDTLNVVARARLLDALMLRHLSALLADAQRPREGTAGTAAPLEVHHEAR